MKINDAIEYFKDASKLARLLKISPQAIYQWETIPPHHQWTIALISNFDLLPDENVLPEEHTFYRLKETMACDNANVRRLNTIAKQLAKRGRDDIIEALIILAEGAKR